MLEFASNRQVWYMTEILSFVCVMWMKSLCPCHWFVWDFTLHPTITSFGLAVPTLITPASHFLSSQKNLRHCGPLFCFQGIYRRPDSCKARYTMMVKAHMAETGEGGPDDPVNLSLPLMTKVQAKELLTAMLPVHEARLRTSQVCH